MKALGARFKIQRRENDHNKAKIDNKGYGSVINEQN